MGMIRKFPGWQDPWDYADTDPCLVHTDNSVSVFNGSEWCTIAKADDLGHLKELWFRFLDGVRRKEKLDKQD